MRTPLSLYGLLLCLCLAPILSAQDAVKSDPAHYTVISENAKVRILKIHYGAHEKSVMHSHPDSVVVFLTDGAVEFTTPDGKKQTMTIKAGESQFTPAGIHLPENTGDKTLEGILVELKPHKAMAAKSEMKGMKDMKESK
jgi:quercetin dioxygenase-like cupin family protein